MITWTLMTSSMTDPLCDLFMLDHPATVHHSAGLGNLCLTGRDQAGGNDKCKCWGHGNGEDDEEDGHCPPTARAAAEIFGKMWEPCSMTWLATRLDRVQSIEIALEGAW